MVVNSNWVAVAPVYRQPSKPGNPDVSGLSAPTWLRGKDTENRFLELMSPETPTNELTFGRSQHVSALQKHCRGGEMDDWLLL